MLLGVVGVGETWRTLVRPPAVGAEPVAPAGHRPAVATPSPSPSTAAAGAHRGAAGALPRLVLRSTARLPVPPGAPSAHAASLAWWRGAAPADAGSAGGPGRPSSAGTLVAVWWAGSRESGPDVRVYLSTLGEDGWAAPRPIVDRESLGRALGFGVRRIGNAVVHAAADGRLHLFVVATGLGGWAAGRVVHLEAPDPGAPFGVRRVLPITPLANTSVLVRAQTLARPQGGWWLPAYFELGVKHPLLLGFDAQGELRSITRIGRSQTSLQPSLLQASDGSLIALMRDHGPQRRIQVAESGDGGATWRDAAALPIGNRDTAVALATIHDPAASATAIVHVLAHNDTDEPGATARSVLRLRLSRDGRTWEPGPDLQRAEPGAEFSYPNLLQVGSQLHAVYTHRREGIGHVVFDIVEGAAP